MKKVLLLGGNGFIGHECVLKLLDTAGHFNVFVANRGKSYDWDKARIKDHVSHITYDRRHQVRDFPEFDRLLQTADFHAVVDFSAFKKSEVKRVLPYLRTKLYIYISSDSVYEVCIKKNPDANSKESDDTRPSDGELVRKFKKADRYGHDKLKCEEYLRSRNSTDRSCVMLRLADVIGPRDGTDRWWQYQLWAKMCSVLNLPIYIPAPLHGKQLSFVYVTDIANVIHDIITMKRSKLEAISNQSFNLACDETISVAELLTSMASNMGNKALTIEHSTTRDVPHMYPSVEKGPVDNSKAHTLLRWSPTPLSKAITSTVAFYEKVGYENEFIEEKQDIYKCVMEELRDMNLYEDTDLAKCEAYLRTNLRLK